MNILSVYSKEFDAYGKIVEDIDFTALLEVLEDTPIPEDVVYEPSVEALEATNTCKQLEKVTYGEMEIQIGYCNGHNNMLNALEYHKTSEINVFATEATLLLGLRSEINNDYTYNTEKVKAFLIPAGTAIEIYATTLHYAPCGVQGKGFQTAIVLPKGTNYPFVEKRNRKEGEDRLMVAVNKWLIGHKEGGLEQGCFLGLIGNNICVYQRS